jgi:fatty-acyl-CoA synthase
VHSYEELLAAAPDSFDWPDVDERSAAAMCYTSGTTGLPKGVVYSHRSTYLHSMAACTANASPFSERDRVMPVVPQFHANAWGLAYAALMSGADLVMPDRFMTAGRHRPKLIETERVTVGAGVPTIWQGVLAHLRAEGGDLSSLRTLVCGGSALPEAVMRAYADEFGITMTHAWGMTELLAARPRRPPADRRHRGGGLAVPGARAGCSAAWRAGWAETAGGAAGRRQGGRRARGPRPLDHRVVLQGPRAGEVPRRLAAHRRRGHAGRARFHPAHRPGQGRDQVRRRVDLLHGARERPDGPPVRGRGRGGRGADEKWGERPLAAVVLRADAPTTPDELRAFIGERIPRWQLPERWCFIAEVPKTSVGKFKKTDAARSVRGRRLEVTRLPCSCALRPRPAQPGEAARRGGALCRAPPVPVR